MQNAAAQVPPPRNEPVLSYAPGTPERAALKRAVSEMASERVEIPVVIGGEAIKTGDTFEVRCPHDHQRVLAVVHKAGEAEVKRAIDAAMEAWKAWQATPWNHRAAVFIKAAELLAGPWRMRLNAATMLGQGKSAHQAEIDAACELIDFWRFNAHYAQQIYAEQPNSAPGVWNSLEHRPLEGFVLAVTPFNFTAIGGNLPTAPAYMGNVTLWKPAETQTLAAWHTLQLLTEAGLPPGVINFLPGHGPTIGDAALASPHLAGVHFTGSAATFQTLWRKVGENLTNYRTYPRVVGETGGKDFVFAHPSADPDALVTALVRGAFEFQGQKCSAASRAYVPASMWAEVRAKLSEEIAQIRQGDPSDFTNFMGAVIDERAFDKITGYIQHARESDDAEILVGGGSDRSRGWFVEPTVVRALSPDLKLLREEIFGPVLTIYVYDDADLEQTLDLVDQGTPYGLTGAIFARDRHAVVALAERLRYAAGNFYINDKPTGAVVGQQPFGGGRASGTNDKAGSMLNLLRWISPRTIKETFVPPTDWRYPFLDAD